MFVDVIHTDGGNFGFLSPLGHADFYPNGGTPVQPGCNLESVIRRSMSRLINQYSMDSRRLEVILLCLEKLKIYNNTTFSMNFYNNNISITKLSKNRSSVEFHDIFTKIPKN